MLNVDRVWARASRRPEFQNRKLSEFGMQAIVLNYTGLTAANEVQNQAAKFPNGAIILGITGGSRQLAQSPTTTADAGLSNFALTLQYEQNRSVIGTASGMAAAVFGVMNDLFPASELYVPTNGNILYSFLSLVSQTISIWITHHCLVPVNVG
jgi:hypothetical protein